MPLTEVAYMSVLRSLKSSSTCTKLFGILLFHNMVNLSAGVSPHDHPCLRACEWPAEVRTCRHEFTVEWYHTVSTHCRDCPGNATDCDRPGCIPANGVPRAVAVVNRRFPGPSIQVCEFDTIEVKVTNKMVGGEGVTIHWHGLHQRGSPHMDGTPMITQCPIMVGASFTYRFRAVTPGTHFWHAHTPQRGDGVVGSLVVRRAPSIDTNAGLYDYDLPEHVVLVQDWLNTPYINRFARIAFHDIAKAPDSILINGRGRPRDQPGRSHAGTPAAPPRHAFHVQWGRRYRFRTIGTSLTACGFEISASGHSLTVIASDGYPVRAVPVRAFRVSSGERIDFVLHARAPLGKYWLRVRGMEACEGMQELAVIAYEGALQLPDPPELDTIDSVAFGPKGFREYSILTNASQFETAETEIDSMTEASVVHYLSIDMPLVNTDFFVHPPNAGALRDSGHQWPATTGLFSAQMNHVSFRAPSLVLLTQSGQLPEGEMCRFNDGSARERCKTHYCHCTHVLEVSLGEVVELVLVNEGQRNANAHPMHLHGHRLKVMALGTIGTSTTVQAVKRLDEEGHIQRRTLGAPFKDTVSVPNGGYAVVRFVADNPGWWLFHCHTEIHLSAGMAMVIRVGTDGDLPPLPRTLPRCGFNWCPAGHG